MLQHFIDHCLPSEFGRSALRTVLRHVANTAHAFKVRLLECRPPGREWSPMMAFERASAAAPRAAVSGRRTDRPHALAPACSGRGPHAIDSRAGRAARRVPIATARIAAGTASSFACRRRPPSVPLASFVLPSKVTVRASIIPARSSRLGTGVTLFSRHARRKDRTSSAPSRYPIPRSWNGTTGTRRRFRMSRSSSARQRSAAIADGGPNRSSARDRNSPMSTASPPVTTSSRRDAIRA